ncbi:MAG: serine hydrolase domain-containing protein [Bacteroidota bacterium]
MQKYLFLILSLLVISCQSQKEPQKQDTVSDLLTQKFQTIADRGNLHGFSISIVDQNSILYKNAFRLADRKEGEAYTTSTKQTTGSISKTLVGIALLKAQELGHLDMDDPISKNLPS